MKQLDTPEEFREAVSTPDKLVVIDFYADWCGPCKRIAPVLEELATKYKKNCLFYKVNIEVNEQVAEELNIRSLPTFHISFAGNLVQTVLGANEELLETAIKTYVQGPDKK